jgi:hypothetical protein
LAEQAERRLLGMDVSGFVSSLRGGMDLYLLISGQVVPNRRDIVEKQSVFNFLQVDAITTAAKRAPEYLTRHCTPDTAATLTQFVGFDEIFADTAAHEFSHPIACTPKVDKLLGPRSVVEEAKATIFGLAAISLVDSDRARQALAVSVYRVCRFLSREKRNDPSSEDYVRENMTMARCLLDAGVMRLTNTGLEVDINNQKAVESWVNLMERFAQQVIESYHDPKDPKAAIQEIVNEIEIFTASEPYLALIAWLDRDDNKSATN